MLTQIIDQIPNFLVRKSLRLFALMLLLHCVAFAQNTSTHRLSDKLQLAAGQQNLEAGVTLELGRPFENEISGGQVQNYRIALSAGQFVSVVVQQRGIDVLEKLFAPGGKLGGPSAHLMSAGANILCSAVAAALVLS